MTGGDPSSSGEFESWDSKHLSDTHIRAHVSGAAETRDRGLQEEALGLPLENGVICVS